MEPSAALENIRILVVDDEPDLRELLRILLEARGYAVREADSGQSAVNSLREDPEVDLVIMDIMMPELDGISACQMLRTFSTAPVLFLTARSQLTDKQSAYASGGDDYLAKPFSREELLMKVESLVRRFRVYQGKPPAGTGGISLDAVGHCAVKNGQRVELTDKEYEILRFFFENRGQTLDVRTVYESVWKEKYLPTSTNTVMVHILNLRKKLEDDPSSPKLIRTVWGKGYQFD